MINRKNLSGESAFFAVTAIAICAVLVAAWQRAGPAQRLRRSTPTSVATSPAQAAISRTVRQSAKESSRCRRRTTERRSAVNRNVAGGWRPRKLPE